MRTDALLPFDETDVEAGHCVPDPVEARIEARDREGRVLAVDPRYNVALEASAGTGKTRVLVERYINLLRAGVDPANILALTFTRKAAAEMRERIVSTLRAAADRGEIAPARWRELRDRLADIGISTIDAFCLSLLREFPLEADLDPGFSMADDTEVPRLIDESLDRTLRVCRALARDDEHVGLVFAQLGDRRVRAGMAALLDRRIVAPAVLSRYLATGPRDLTLTTVARRGASSLMDVFLAMRGGLERFVETGPPEPGFLLLETHLRAVEAGVLHDAPIHPPAVYAAFARTRDYFLTQDGQPRNRLAYPRVAFASAADWRIHRDLVTRHAAAFRAAHGAFRRDLNLLVSRGVWRMFRVAETEYRRTLESHAVLDFSEVLLRTLDLLRRMEEFSRSRYRLEARYHHVLVDEFQDTSRAQWQLISLLVQSWGEGAGLAHTGPIDPSIFIVGDRKQSIYGFRDAEVAILPEASRYIGGLRPGGGVRRSISRSFRSAPALLAFVNALFHDVEKAGHRADAFRYEEEDRFPIAGATAGDAVVSLVAAETSEACAAAAAVEIKRLIAEETTVRDRVSGVARPVRPGDIAILFRTRESHREFEEALERRGIPSYVYKGLGFFDADEIRDMLALLWYLADPASDLRAAAWLRSRFVRMTDDGLKQLAPRLADAIADPAPPHRAADLDPTDREAFHMAREASKRWRGLVDRLPPAELLDTILAESAYAAELRGPRLSQARENLKKLRALVRRIQNRGYATVGRIAAHLDRLALGDEANAVIDAHDAVSLMTVHAAKGLEFPIVFVVNLARGAAYRRAPIRVSRVSLSEAISDDDDVSVSVGDFLSETDEDDAAREREETKRLLYVALTRARDRLYLGTAVKAGIVQPGRGSLAEVMPASLLASFTDAALLGGEREPRVVGDPAGALDRGNRGAGARGVAWRSTSGSTHILRVCPPPPGSGDGESRVHVSGPEEPAAVDFDPVQDTMLPGSGVACATDSPGAYQPAAAAQDSSTVVGTLVHRLLHRYGLDAAFHDATAPSLVWETVRQGEVVLDENGASAWARIVRAYHSLSHQPDVRKLYAAGRAFHELPFSMSVDGRIVRGTIDCVICTGSGSVTVLEFKTGRPRKEHEEQLELYRRAAEALFPDSVVDARLVYAEEMEPG